MILCYPNDPKCNSSQEGPNLKSRSRFEVNLISKDALEDRQGSTSFCRILVGRESKDYTKANHSNVLGLKT